MSHWVRFDHNNEVGFGKVDGQQIEVYAGDMFAEASSKKTKISLSEVNIKTPCVPGKFIALWNNSISIAQKQNLDQPEYPLYFIKTPNTYLPSGGVIRKPNKYEGRVIFEAELGIVIGKECKEISIKEAESAIFGYTCVNDTTAIQILDADPSFAQWSRAKGFDTFGAFGPYITTGTNIADAAIRAELNGRQRQNYLVSDLLKQPIEIISLLSQSMTLYPGDLIACGTGPGALPMKPGSSIEITIDGIGRLSNSYEE
jgi:2-keto-4-pentenoate hydratase/2-oxohepta-3-ene-1,7-dioic acid hydratase in catechol pathway